MSRTLSTGRAINEALQIAMESDPNVILLGEDVVGGGALDATLSWKDPSPVTERSWVYVKVTQTDGECAWSSPVWIDAG